LGCSVSDYEERKKKWVPIAEKLFLSETEAWLAAQEHWFKQKNNLFREKEKIVGEQKRGND